jgi:hypothetical protein
MPCCMVGRRFFYQTQWHVEEVKWAKSRSSGTLSSKLPMWSQPAKIAEPCRGSNASHSFLSSHLLVVYLNWLGYASMACIPMAYPPMSPVPKSEPESTPQPWSAPAWKLPNLGPYPTSFPSANGVQRKKQKKQRPRLPYQQTMRSIAHLSPVEQVVQLRQSRKAIMSKLCSKIARLQVGTPTSITLLDTPMLTHDKA